MQMLVGLSVCWSVCGHFVIFQLIKLIEQIELNKYQINIREVRGSVLTTVDS